MYHLHFKTLRSLNQRGWEETHSAHFLNPLSLNVLFDYVTKVILKNIILLLLILKLINPGQG